MRWARTAAAITALGVLIIGPRLLRTSSSTGRRELTLVVLSPHHEAIQYEFSQGFTQWHAERYGQRAYLDWRNVGNTGQISRYVASEFDAAFDRFYRRRHGRPIPLSDWTRPSRYRDRRQRALAEQIRDELLAPGNASHIGIGVDLVFGGGPFEHERFRRAGYSVPCPVNPHVLQGIPQQWGGVDYYYIDEQPGEHRRAPHFDPTKDWRPDADGYWYGAALTGFGIVFNRVALNHPRVRLPDPLHWGDLADPRLSRWVGLADPRDSGSATVGFEMIIQTAIAAELRQAKQRSAAVEAGWRKGLNLIKRLGANARFFTESSTRVPLDVAARNAAAGMAIDFYGRFQSEYVGGEEVGYVSPPGGSMISPDPIGLLRGAPHHELATRFVEYVLSVEGQMLWDLPAGFVDSATRRRGPRRTTNRRMAIRPDVYELYGPFLKNQENPFDDSADLLDYRPEYTARLFRLLRTMIGAMCIDTHDELREAWEALSAAAAPGAQAPQDSRLQREAEEQFDWLPITHAEAMMLAGADDEQIRAIHPGWSPTELQRERRDAISDDRQRAEIALAWLLSFREKYRRVSRAAVGRSP